MIVIRIIHIVIHCFLCDCIAFFMFFPAEKRPYKKTTFTTIYNITNVLCVIIPVVYHLTEVKYIYLSKV